MKKLSVILLILAASSSSYAVSVCVFRATSQGNERALHLVCSHTGNRAVTSLIAESTEVADNRTPIFNAKVNAMQRLYAQGYKAVTEDMFVKP